MSPELVYLLKVNLAIALFYVFYRLLFYKDTFFRLRRILLLLLFGIAFLYPFFTMPEWVREQEPLAEAVTLYTAILPEEVQLITSVEEKAEWDKLSLQDMWYGYIGILLLLMIRFFVQLISILHLSIFRCKKIEIQGIAVRVPDRPVDPFSFFNLIFIYPQNQTSGELEEILVHERTHARQFHSVDAVISELLSIICWFNPFVWLLKREVRHNLEYLADNTVIQAGYDSRSYQYHLLGAVCGRGRYSLYNNFNITHLKKRINMMNKKRSKDIGRAKCLFFIPLAGTLMLLSNIEATARVADTFAEKMTSITADEKLDVQRNVKVTDGDSIHLLVDKNSAIKNGIQGDVLYSFFIDKDRKVTDVNIAKKVDPFLDAEAIRVVSTMSNWISAEKDNKKVKVKRNIAIRFRLDDKVTFVPMDKSSGIQISYSNIVSLGADRILVSSSSSEIFYAIE